MYEESIAFLLTTPVAELNIEESPATVGYGMTSIGLAPPWLKIVLLMIIGVIASVAAIRVTR